jgi:hypothetical protein
MPRESEENTGRRGHAASRQRERERERASERVEVNKRLISLFFFLHLLSWIL